MKKLIFILPVFLTFGLVFPAFAAKNNEVGVQNTSLSTGQQVQQQVKTSVSPTGNQVQNQNQIKTKNEGADSQLQIENQEQENLEESSESGSQNRNQNAVQNMSEVAAQVQQLLQIRTTRGIGEQVRQVAQAQNQAQTQIQEQINKLDSKGKLARIITGTDYGAVKNLKQQLGQNQLRIRQLEQLQNQLTNQGDITAVQEAVQALIRENTSIQDRIMIEEQAKSLFGWFFKLFIR